MVTALFEAGLTGFSTFDIDVKDTDIGDRYVGFVVHRVRGGTEVYTRHRNFSVSSVMVNERAMRAPETSGTMDFVVTRTEEQMSVPHRSAYRTP